MPVGGPCQPPWRNSSFIHADNVNGTVSGAESLNPLEKLLLRHRPGGGPGTRCPGHLREGPWAHGVSGPEIPVVSPKRHWPWSVGSRGQRSREGSGGQRSRGQEGPRVLGREGWRTRPPDASGESGEGRIGAAKLPINSLGRCEGANAGFPARPQLRHFCFLSASFRHHPVSPGRPEDPVPRVEGVPQQQATGTPGAQETAPCLRASSVGTLGSLPSELSPLPSDPAQWPGGEKGGPS